MAMTLKAWRKAKGFTQEQMANILDIHVNTYINWESEPQKISIENGAKICLTLGINFDDVIFLPDNSTKM